MTALHCVCYWTRETIWRSCDVTWSWIWISAAAMVAFDKQWHDLTAGNITGGGVVDQTSLSQRSAEKRGDLMVIRASDWLTGATTSYLPPSPLPRPGYWFPSTFISPPGHRGTRQPLAHSFLSANTKINLLANFRWTFNCCLWQAFIYKKTPFVCDLKRKGAFLWYISNFSYTYMYNVHSNNLSLFIVINIFYHLNF